MFADAVRRAYGDRLKGLVVFGSRARGDASPDNDLDVAVILAGDVDLYGEKTALADLAYDAIVETGVHVQAWPVSTDEWQDPEKHSNPFLVRAMRRDGTSVQKLSKALERLKLPATISTRKRHDSAGNRTCCAMFDAAFSSIKRLPEFNWRPAVQGLSRRGAVGK